MNVSWRSGLPADGRVVDPGQHGTYPSPTVPAVEAGGLVHLCGIVGMDADRRIAEGGAGAQASQALTVIGNALAGLGGSLADVVRLTIYLARKEDLAEVSSILDTVFDRPWPPTTIVAVAALATPGLLVEIESVATACDRGH